MMFIIVGGSSRSSEYLQMSAAHPHQLESPLNGESKTFARLSDIQTNLNVNTLFPEEKNSKEFIFRHILAVI